MTEKMFKYFSKEGAKLVPSICPATERSSFRDALISDFEYLEVPSGATNHC